MFVHKAEFKREEDKQITETIKNIEGKDYLQYEWLDLDKIEADLLQRYRYPSLDVLIRKMEFLYRNNS